MLKLQLKDKPQKSIWLVGDSLTVGKGRANNLVINDPDIEDVHAELRMQGDKIYLIDKSGAKTSVNNQVLNKYQLLNLGDVIRLNTVELEIVDPKTQQLDLGIPIGAAGGKGSAPRSSVGAAQADQEAESNQWSLVATGSFLAGKRYVLGETTTIGRDKTCDIVIPGTHLSRLHAQLSIHGNYLNITDLDSSNGTYVNDKKITESRMKPGDQVKFDVFTFRVEGPEPEFEQTLMRPALNLEPLESKDQLAPIIAPEVAKPKPQISVPVAPVSMGDGSISGASNNKWLGAMLTVIAVAAVVGVSLLYFRGQ